MTRLIFTCFSLIFCVFSGCVKQDAPAPNQTSKQTVADRDRPPLRIGLISQPTGLDELLRMRWASVSEQRLEFVTLKLEDVLSKDNAPKVDLVFAPAMHIGSLVESQAVTELPTEIVDAVLKSPESAGIVAFPEHWIKMAQYGKKQYGIPYGSSLVLVGSESNSADTVTARASTAVPTVVLDWPKYKLERPTEEVSESGPDIVDHFVAIAASCRPNFYEGSMLFKVVDGSSRLSESWLVDCSATLRTLYASSNANDFKHVELGWETSKSDTKNGWAAPTVERKLEISNPGANEAGAKFETQQWACMVDCSRAPVLYISSNTRQSSQGLYFMKWLCESPQKIAIAKSWPWSFNVAEGAEAGRTNTYRAVSFKAAQLSGDIATIFQLRGGWQYRELLKQSLNRIVDDQQLDIEQEMEACRLQWDQLTDSLGKELQQDSLERTLN